ncbi:MAG: glycosyltransferase family 4 protein [Solirubrobacterales bacterium]|nr:glycosyltransferase family 4 protein [Solirubrobacterales bacterium]MBV9808702.1 glycosyltransferase family 4 protein [Solirubrobacterales bacterium]
MRILFVNHTGLKSGAETVTLDLLTRLPSSIEPVLACPPGRLADEARAEGIPVNPIGGVSASLRLHYANTPRGVAQLVRMGRDIRALARDRRADLVHATSIRAGLAACLPPGPRAPVAVSLHDCLPPGPASTVTRRLVDARAAVVFANSCYTARAWRPAERSGPPLRVVYPGIDLARRAAGDRDAARARMGVSGAGPILGVAAQITPWKGQATAIRALRGVRERLPGAQLVLAGEPKFVERTTRYDNSAYLRELQLLVAALGLESAVHFLGQREDMPTVMAAIDALLVPSTEEPFGLVVVEAMAAGTPVVATTNGGPAEIIRDGIDGRLAPPCDAERWATTVCDVLLDPTVRDRIIHAGRERARRFSAERHAAEVVAAYEHALR